MVNAKCHPRSSHFLVAQLCNYIKWPPVNNCSRNIWFPLHHFQSLVFYLAFFFLGEGCQDALFKLIFHLAMESYICKGCYRTCILIYSRCWLENECDGSVDNFHGHILAAACMLYARLTSIQQEYAGLFSNHRMPSSHGYLAPFPYKVNCCRQILMYPRPPQWDTWPAKLMARWRPVIQSAPHAFPGGAAQDRMLIYMMASRLPSSFHVLTPPVNSSLPPSSDTHWVQSYTRGVFR